MQSAWRQKGFKEELKPKELSFKSLEEFLVPTWELFKKLGSRRNWSDHGPRPISFAEIVAFQSIDGKLERWRIQAVIAIDNAFLDTWIENNK